MNIHSILNVNYKQNKEIVVLNLPLLTKSFEAKSVHKVRVAIKKLKACLELFNHLYRNEAPFEIPATGSLFKILGKYRQWDVVLENLDHFRLADMLLFPEFKKHIIYSKKEIARECRSFLQEYSETELSAIESRIAHVGLAEENAESELSVTKLIKSKFAKVKRLSLHKEVNAHNIRKELKSVYYWIVWWGENGVVSKREMKQLDIFLEKAGSWHDLLIIGGIIKNFRRYYLANTDGENQALKQLTEDINKRRKKLIRNIGRADIAHQLSLGTFK